MIMKSEDFTSEVGIKYELIPPRSFYPRGPERFRRGHIFGELNAFDVPSLGLPPAQGSVSAQALFDHLSVRLPHHWLEMQLILFALLRG